MELNEILELPVNNDGEEMTIRSFLYELLSMVITEQEQFDGKRPWGNSSWIFNLYKTLIQAKLINGSFDDDGYVENINELEAEKFVINHIIKPFFQIK